MEFFKEIAPAELPDNAFSLIGKDWTLITVKSGGQVNTMTASWGGIGVLWNKNVVTVFLRPQRYTRELLDNADGFSLNFFPDGFRDKLAYCGKISGRDEDKIAKCGFDLQESHGAPCFAEARIVLMCKKLYRQKLDPACFLDASLDESNYPNKDYHIMYIGEIEHVYVK